MITERMNIPSASTKDEAARWYAKMHAGDAMDANTDAFMEWLLISEDHSSAYDELCQKIALVDKHRAEIGTVFEDEIRSSKETDGQVSFLANLAKRKFSHIFAWPRAASLAAVAATILFFAFAPLSPFYSPPPQGVEYSTFEGGIRHIKLADGSRVTLDTLSEISVSMFEDRREVNLLAGKAFFDVASDASKPFFVTTNRHAVKVVGTRFEVSVLEGAETVSVEEGLVSVSEATTDSGLTAPAVLVEPGFSVQYEPGTPQPVLTELDVNTIAQWRKGQLQFTKAEIHEVLAQINRYYPNSELTLDAQISPPEPFSGVIALSTPKQTAIQLSAIYGYEVKDMGDKIILKEKD